jgi:hypothetical protein
MADFSSTQDVVVSTDAFCITAFKQHHTRYALSILDANAALIPIDTSNVVRVKIGKDNQIPILDINSTAATANGSSVTNVNPLILVIDQDDVTFTPGIYDMELLVMDDATGDSITHIAHGIFVLQATQLGAIAVT